MKIGIDISSIIYGTGVSLYTKNLVKSLYKYHPEHDYILFGGSLRGKKTLKEFSKSLSKKNQEKIYSLPPKIQSFIFNQLNFPIETLTGELDVFHSWDWYTPKTFKSKLITTIHDLSAIKYPQDTHPEIVKKHKKSLNRIKKNADAIIAVSKFTKKEIVKILKIDPKKIHVIPEALPEENIVSTKKHDIKNTLDKFQISKPFFLAVASLEPRKNLKRVIQSFQRFKDDYQLVLVGKSGYETINEEESLIKTGYVSSKELASLYQGAKLLLYPSIYEGFGLPILEAFHHQLPVVTSNTSSMPEVAGDAAILVNPHSQKSIEEGILKAMKDKDELISKSNKRLKLFSWRKVADQTMKVYESK